MEAEVVRRPAQSGTEMVLPQPVHCHTAHQRIIATRHPFGELQPSPRGLCRLGWLCETAVVYGNNREGGRLHHLLRTMTVPLLEQMQRRRVLPQIGPPEHIRHT